MTSTLTNVPVGARRRAALVLSGLSIVLLGVAILPWTAPAPAVIRGLATVAGLVGVLTVLLAWGLRRSITLDARHRTQSELDAVLIAAAGSCDCGNDHVVAGHTIPAASFTGAGPAPGPAPAVAGASGAGAGAGASGLCAVGDDTDCTHTCASCVLANRG